MKKLFATASLLALLAAAPVQAQQPPPQQQPPAATPTTPAPDASRPAPSPGATAPAPTTEVGKKPDTQKTAMPGSAGDWRASKLIGQTIRNAANESIGDVNDLMIDSSGKVTAVIVGVGGFLGIGEKNVSLPFEKLSFSRDANNALTVTASVTKDSLQSAPEFAFPDARTSPGTSGTAPSPGTGTSR